MNVVLNYRSKIIYYIALFFIFLMLYRNSWLPFSKQLSGKEVYIVALLTFGLIVLVFDFNHILNQNILFYIEKNKLFLTLFILFIISTVAYNIQEISQSTYYLFRFIAHISYFLLYFVIFPKFLFQNKGYFNKFILFIIILGNFTGVIGLTLLFFNLNPRGLYSDFAVSYIWHPNFTAFVYTVSIFATIFYLDKELHSPLKKLYLLAGLLLQSYALILTYCRAAMIGVVIGISVYYTLKYRKKVILFLPILAMVISFLIERIYATKGLGSTLSRFYLIIPALQMIKESWVRFIWGYGITNNFEVFRHYMIIYNVTEENVNNPHNALLSLFMMYGALFTILLLIYLLYVLYNIFVRSIKAKDKKEKIFFSFIISSMIALIVQNLFDSQILQPEFFCMQYFLIYFGLSHFLITSKSKKIPVSAIWDE